MHTACSTTRDAQKRGQGLLGAVASGRKVASLKAASARRRLAVVAAAACLAVGVAGGAHAQEAAELHDAMATSGVYTLAPDGWSEVKQELLTEQVRRAWEGMDSQSRQQLLAGMSACRTFIASKPSTNSVINVTVFSFETPELAKKAVADLEAMTRLNIQRGTVPGVKASQVSYGTFKELEGLSANSTVAFNAKVGSGNKVQAIDLYTARVARGNVVIEYMRINHAGLKNDTVAKVMGNLYETLEIPVPAPGNENGGDSGEVVLPVQDVPDRGAL